MKLQSVSFFNLASQRMEWLSARQKVIAENVANADTPGYKARDVSSFKELLENRVPSGGMAVTSPKHIAGTDPVGDVRVHEDTRAWADSIDGNTVTLEQQAIKANEVSESYGLAARLYRKGYELLTISVTGLK